jgi:hypothetical protein
VLEDAVRGAVPNVDSERQNASWSSWASPTGMARAPCTVLEKESPSV